MEETAEVDLTKLTDKELFEIIFSAGASLDGKRHKAMHKFARRHQIDKGKFF